MSGISPEVYELHMNETEFKPGKYLITDPCYVIGGDPYWGEMCEWIFEDEERRDPFYTKIGEFTIFNWGTAHGDGSYPVEDNNGVSGLAGVDAGMLAVIPMEYILQNNLDASCGVVVELKEEATPEVDGGDLTLGNICVNTSGEGDDEDEDEEPEYCPQCGREIPNYDGTCECEEDEEDC